MANLPPNSFLKPVEPVQASPYQRIDPKALGGLQPLVSDLIQTNAPKNKFLAETYSADPNAIQSRMSEYEAYDPTQFETMAGYLSPLAAASHNGAQFFKKGSVQDALGKLTGFDAHTLSQMSPLLGGLSGVGSMGGNTFYDKTALENQLKSQFGGNFAVMTPDKVRELQATMPEFGTGRFAPTYSTDNSLFYGADALRGVNELAGVYEYLKKINLPLNYTSFMQQYGATPAGGWSDANTKNYNAVPKYLDGLRLNPEYKLEKPILQRWMDDPSYLPNFSLLGSGSPEDIQRGFNLLQRMSPQNINEFWGLAPEVQRGMLENPAAALQQMRAMANPANGDWLSVGAEGGYNNLAAYNWDPQRGLTADRSQYMNINDEGPFGDNFITDILDNKYVNTVLSVIPVTAPYMGAYNAVNALHNDNPVGAILSGVGGALSASGLNPASVIGKGTNTALNLGLGTAGQMALGGSLYGAGMGALRGGDLQGALTGALTGGLGGYAGNYMSGLTKDMSPLTKMAVQTAYGSGVGGLSSMVQGKGFSQGASNAARRGVTNAAINAALNSQLYKGLV